MRHACGNDSLLNLVSEQTVLLKKLLVVLQVPNTSAEWEEVMNGFETHWQFPNVCGALDGKHVTIRCPAHTGSQYYSYKKSFSTILFAVVDAEYNFLYVDVGTNGRVNDAAVFAKSAFCQALDRKTLHVPDRGIFIGDDAFPLRSDLLKPFSRSGPLSETQLVFNYRLSRARRVVENAFGLLVSRFRVYEKPVPLNIETTEHMVKATCALHNWLRKTSSPAEQYGHPAMLATEDCRTGVVTPGAWTHNPHAALQDFPRTRCTSQSKHASAVRQHYADLFVTSHAVPWQSSRI